MFFTKTDRIVWGFGRGAGLFEELQGGASSRITWWAEEPAALKEPAASGPRRFEGKVIDGENARHWGRTVARRVRVLSPVTRMDPITALSWTRIPTSPGRWSKVCSEAETPKVDFDVKIGTS